MADDYSKVKLGKLKLKGEKRSHKKHKSKKRKHENEGSSNKVEDNDTLKHGGWWKTTAISQMRGCVAVQVGNSPAYIRAMDNGLFMLGALHDEGEGPAPEEILTVVPGGRENYLAFKSGYDKYLGVESNGRVSGRADAIGPLELWQPVFQEGKTALLAANDCFVGVDGDDNVVAASVKAGENEMIIIRTNVQRESEKVSEIPEEKGKLRDVEINYVKMFQKFQDKKMLVNQEGKAALKKARTEGDLHEALLDRRSKMKADRYCK